jgi:hypothetical protein
VVDHQTDLVDVTGQHDPRLAVRDHGGETVTCHIRPDPIGKRLGLLAPGASRHALESGRPGQRQQALEELY